MLLLVLLFEWELLCWCKLIGSCCCCVLFGWSSLVAVGGGWLPRWVSWWRCPSFLSRRALCCVLCGGRMGVREVSSVVLSLGLFVG